MQDSRHHRFIHIRAAMFATLVSTAMVASVSAQEVTAASGVGPGGIGAAAIGEVKASVVGIDAASNRVTLRGPNGRVVDVAVNSQLADVSKLRLGDVVDIRFRGSLLIRADKVKSDGIRERIDESATIPASGGITASVQRTQVLATVEKVDAKKRLITLRGPNRTEVIKVAPDVPLAQLKVGDMVKAQVETATAVQVMRDGVALK
jgi:Cu/Ag efflux protein CusF